MANIPVVPDWLVKGIKARLKKELVKHPDIPAGTSAMVRDIKFEMGTWLVYLWFESFKREAQCSVHHVMPYEPIETDKPNEELSFKIEPKFESLLPPLKEEEFENLENNILTHGCSRPLTVWKGHNILLDGHHRLKICQRHGIKYQIQEVELATFEDAFDWIIDNQCGQRNLTPEKLSYLRGKRYNSLKAKVTSPCGRKGKNQQGKIDPQNADQFLQRTCDKLAEEYKVNKSTIERDGKYAQAVDYLSEVGGEEIKSDLLNGDLKMTKKETLNLAKEAQENPEYLEEVIAQKKAGESSSEVSNMSLNGELDKSLRIGQLCRIKAGNNKELQKYHKYWGFLKDSDPYFFKIETCLGVINEVRERELEVIQCNDNERKKYEKLCQKIQRLVVKNKDEFIEFTLTFYCTLKQPVLTELQEFYLEFLEQKLSFTDEDKN